MRCSPLRWLYGLLPLAVVWGLGLLSLKPLVETELTNRVANALTKKGLDWATPVLAGRDVELIGRGSEDKELADAAATALGVPGVRIVDNKTSLIDKANTYIWNASLRDKRIKLSGFVPSEQVRKQMIGMVQAKFPGLEIQDLTKLARGEPNRDVWLAGMSFALNQLTQLNQGSVELDGTNLVIEGDAEDAKAYRSVIKAVASERPQSIGLKSEKVRPPVVKPYTWAAAAVERGQLVLSGYVPSDAERKLIESEARRQFPKRQIVDRMEFASGEPKGYEAAVLASLKSLATLEEGTAEVKDAALSLTGVADTQAIADAAKKSLRDATPGMRHTGTVTIKEAPLPVADPFTTSATIDSGVVTLTGFVPTEAVRSQIVEAVKARLPGRRIENRLQLATGAPEGWLPCVQAGLVGLARVGNGQAAVTGNKVLVTGTTSDNGLQSAVADDVAAAAGPRCTSDVRLAVFPDAKKVAEEEAARAKAAAELKAKQEADARAKADAEAKARAEAEAKAKLDADARARAEADAKARAEAEAKAKADADARARAEADAKARAEADARAKADADAKAAAAAVAARAQAQAQECKATLARVASEGVINFERASANLTQQSFATLDRLVAVVRSCPVERIDIEGHTDAEGIPERNQPLSERRAQAVVTYLVRAGIPEQQLRAIGYGAERPIAPNDTAEGRARNRRIAFEVKPRQ